MRVLQRTLVYLSLFPGLMIAVGCEPKGLSGAGDPSLAEQGREVFRPGGSGGAPEGDAGAGESESGSWAVVLAACRGADQEREAAAMLDRIRTTGGLPEAYSERRGKATILAVGRFDSPNAKEATATLARVRGMVIGGARPYAAAMLAPPGNVGGSSTMGRYPQYELTRARARLGGSGPRSTLYTLQIGVYARDEVDFLSEADLAEVRRSAEEAVVRLRNGGEEAFYFHAPRRSMVTVGLFTADDFDSRRPGQESDRLRAARQRHPNNLYNGAGYIDRKSGSTAPQPSALVEVPTP
ncbi:MAG: hypothetical protein JNM07_07655 [Phycisphaerae bacterium]|nr:hypothetical protein [Phycisphaerae bacterium]